MFYNIFILISGALTLAQDESIHGECGKMVKIIIPFSIHFLAILVPKVFAKCSISKISQMMLRREPNTTGD